MKFRLKKEFCILAIQMGFLLIVIGVTWSLPLNINWSKILTEFLSVLVGSWWPVILVPLGFVILAYALAWTRYHWLSEHIGTLAFIVLLSPLFGIISGLPKELGFGLVFIMFGFFYWLFGISQLMTYFLLKTARNPKKIHLF
ncbi:MAG: hypothetical protein K0U41_01240 [Gammaproteobacteria bacterium]|nr:hypothetical protein [Gammaproteobacteria bacterium]